VPLKKIASYRIVGTPKSIPPIGSPPSYTPSTSTKLYSTRAVLKDFTAQLAKYKVTSYAWYFIAPIFIIYIFSPGFLISIPAVKHCDSKDVSNFTPGRVTWINVIVSSLLIWGLILLHYFIGASVGIAFPLQHLIFNAHVG
jgi:hypothetical protein